MLEILITSKTRINLLLKFFLNSKNTAWLRSLESEFPETSNAIRLELLRLERAELLKSRFVGNKKVYQANTKHPLFPEINSLLMKHFGLDEVVERVTKKLGDLDKVYLVGKLAKGQESKMVDFWFVGEKIDKNYLLKVIEKAEIKIGRKIRYITLSKSEFKDFAKNVKENELLLLWKS